MIWEIQVRTFYIWFICLSCAKKCLVKIDSEIMNRKTEGWISKYDI